MNIKSKHMEHLEEIDKKEEALYLTMQTWRESLGRDGWASINGTWRRTVLGYDLSFGSYGPSTEEMSESEIEMYDRFSDILDHLQKEKKIVLENYLETFKQ